MNERLEHFWRRWRREYLTDLTECHNCNAKRAGREPKVGDVVIVFEDGAKRNSWKMVVIEELIHGWDSKVRGANARVVTKGKTHRLSRPLQKLYPIKVQESSTDVPRNRERQGEREQTLQKCVIPCRAVALDAAWKTREMMTQPDD